MMLMGGGISQAPTMASESILANNSLLKLNHIPPTNADGNQHGSLPSHASSRFKGQNHHAEFLDRFQGKLTHINKDGHIGVVHRPGQPIHKQPDNHDHLNNSKNDMSFSNSQRVSGVI